MTRLALLGAAVVASYAMLSGPALAQHRTARAAIAATGGDWCAGREPGNPYTKEEDYQAWSAWRARGGWDDHNDFKCGPVRLMRGGF
jgi:hypothetical protein